MCLAEQDQITQALQAELDGLVSGAISPAATAQPKLLDSSAPLDAWGIKSVPLTQ